MQQLQTETMKDMKCQNRRTWKIKKKNILEQIYKIEHKVTFLSYCFEDQFMTEKDHS